MIQLSIDAKPYSVKNESGDFYQYIELEDYFLLVVGDIGGHGSGRVYALASDIQNLIEKNKEKSLSQIITIIHKQEMLHNNGMALFIAQIYKNMPMINYSAVGNTKGTIVRKNNFLPLNGQEGILGYDIPTSIKTYMTKILDGDILIVYTDGVTIHKEELINKFKNTNNIELITKYCVENFGKDDDRLCVALLFTIDNNKHFSIKHNDNEIKKIEQKFDSKRYQNNTVTMKKKIDHHNTNIQKQEYYFQQYQEKKPITLNQERLLIKRLSSALVRDVISKIATLAKIELGLRVKIKTFLYEVTKHSDVDIYLDNFLLQIEIHDIKHFQESLGFLFGDFFISNQKKAIINIQLPSFSSFSNEQFNNLKEMFELGFDDSEYTKYKENEKQMQQMSSQARLSAMGEMIGNIAHQWRQPLSVISTSATSLSLQKELGFLTDEMLYKACDTINESAQYLSKTIDDFRDFIKGDNFEEEFTVDTLLSKALNIVEASLKDNYITLTITKDDNVKIFGAINLLIQVVVNIINNAKDILIEKCVEEKLVFVDVVSYEDKITLAITDNAGGVPKEIQDKIFDAYFTTKHQSKGTGLGLNMAFNIILNSFKGTLEVENKIYSYHNIEQKGASFIITLPLRK